MPEDQSPVTIRRYAERLYDPARGRYVTLEDLHAMIEDGRDIAVHDARSGEDVTRSVLTRIILKQRH